MIFLFAVFGGDAVLDLELLLLGTEIIIIRAQNKILGSMEIELFAPILLHCQIIASNMNLIITIRVNDHLSFGFSQQVLHILRLHSIANVLILRRERLLRAVMVDCCG